jgi:hypothetical protein
MHESLRRDVFSVGNKREARVNNDTKTFNFIDDRTNTTILKNITVTTSVTSVPLHLGSVISSCLLVTVHVFLSYGIDELFIHLPERQ